MGLVSGVQRATRAAAELSASEQALGAERVRQVAAELRPRYVALLGLTLYPVFFRRGTARGPGLTSNTIAEARVFVLPNPSGRNRAYPGFESKLIWFRALAETLRR